MAFALAGFFFGIVGGMGMGGGIILIPVLTLFLGVSQHGAQGLNLLCFLPMAGFALGAHIKQKRVDFRVAITFAITGLVGSLSGAYLAGLLESKLLSKLFGGLLIVLGIVRAVELIKRLRQKRRER